MRTYTIEAVQDLINRYYERDNDIEITEVVEGVLGYGTTIIEGEGLKTAIIQERYLNEWSSSHTIRLYNVIPKKYELLKDKYFEELDRQDAEFSANLKG